MNGIVLFTGFQGEASMTMPGWFVTAIALLGGGCLVSLVSAILFGAEVLWDWHRAQKDIAKTFK